MKGKGFYSDAHLVVAAIRILEHQKFASPSIDEVCRTISFSLEQGNFVCRKLNEMNIIDVVEGAFGTKLFIKDHLLLEEIPQGAIEDNLEKELKQFQNAKKDYIKKIELFKSEQEKKKKNLFAELEKKFKKDLDEKKSK
jgi:Rps23 Pro-64 3,4-dihydroxylase Tpa1-like proline 4-hydroxylase